LVARCSAQWYSLDTFSKIHFDVKKMIIFLT